MTTELKKGDIVEIELDNLAHGGECVGHFADGLAVFVPGGIPGERVKIRITVKKKNYARGELLKVLQPAEARTEPVCSVADGCGGCQLQHVDYQEQLLHKKQMVIDLLKRIGGFENIKVNDPIGADYPFNYRNKAQFPLTKTEDKKIATGFYKKGSHNVVVNESCIIQHPLINRIVARTLAVLNDYEMSVYNEKTHRGLLRHLVIRTGVCTNQALLTIVTSRKTFKDGKEIASKLLQQIPELVGVIQNINREKTNVIMGCKNIILAGQDYYLDFIGNVRFKISPFSFFQVNTLQTRKLYDIVKKYANLAGKETVLDAYCGIGSIALYLADGAKKVIGIEEVAMAIEDARENARLNNIDNCQFITGRVEEILPRLVKDGLKPDLVVFDPPRKGLDERVIKVINKIQLARIIYVSCNPATLSRDLARMKENYEIKAIQPVDMFPQTYHVETVVSLQLKEGIL